MATDIKSAERCEEMAKKDGKNNLNQAMYEMFGIGKEPDVNVRPEEPEPEAAPTEELERVSIFDDEPIAEPVKPAAEKTYLAVGTLKAEGDVEIAGDVQGNIISSGNVILRSNITGNITAAGLAVAASTLEGDANVSGRVHLSEASTLNGNICADSVLCDGRMKGDIDAKSDVTLGRTAYVEGNIKAGTMAMERGAVVIGSIQMEH